MYGSMVDIESAMADIGRGEKRKKKKKNKRQDENRAAKLGYSVHRRYGAQALQNVQIGIGQILLRYPARDQLTSRSWIA